MGYYAILDLSSSLKLDYDFKDNFLVCKIVALWHLIKS